MSDTDMTDHTEQSGDSPPPAPVPALHSDDMEDIPEALNFTIDEVRTWYTDIEKDFRAKRGKDVRPVIVNFTDGLTKFLLRPLFCSFPNIEPVWGYLSSITKIRFNLETPPEQVIFFAEKCLYPFVCKNILSRSYGDEDSRNAVSDFLCECAQLTAFLSSLETPDCLRFVAHSLAGELFDASKKEFYRLSGKDVGKSIAIRVATSFDEAQGLDSLKLLLERTNPELNDLCNIIYILKGFSDLGMKLYLSSFDRIAEKLAILDRKAIEKVNSETMKKIIDYFNSATQRFKYSPSMFHVLETMLCCTSFGMRLTAMVFFNDYFTEVFSTGNKNDANDLAYDTLPEPPSENNTNNQNQGSGCDVPNQKKQKNIETREKWEEKRKNLEDKLHKREIIVRRLREGQKDETDASLDETESVSRPCSFTCLVFNPPPDVGTHTEIVSQSACGIALLAYCSCLTTADIDLIWKHASLDSDEAPDMKQAACKVLRRALSRMTPPIFQYFSEKCLGSIPPERLVGAPEELTGLIFETAKLEMQEGAPCKSCFSLLWNMAISPAPEVKWVDRKFATSHIAMCLREETSHHPDHFGIAADHAIVELDNILKNEEVIESDSRFFGAVALVMSLIEMKDDNISALLGGEIHKHRFDQGILKRVTRNVLFFKDELVLLWCILYCISWAPHLIRMSLNKNKPKEMEDDGANSEAVKSELVETTDKIVMALWNALAPVPEFRKNLIDFTNSFVGHPMDPSSCIVSPHFLEELLHSGFSIIPPKDYEKNFSVFLWKVLILVNVNLGTMSLPVKNEYNCIIPSSALVDTLGAIDGFELAWNVLIQASDDGAGQNLINEILNIIPRAAPSDEGKEVDRRKPLFESLLGHCLVVLEDFYMQKEKGKEVPAYSVLRALKLMDNVLRRYKGMNMNAVVDGVHCGKASCLVRKLNINLSKTKDHACFHLTGNQTVGDIYEKLFKRFPTLEHKKSPKETKDESDEFIDIDDEDDELSFLSISENSTSSDKMEDDDKTKPKVEKTAVLFCNSRFLLDHEMRLDEACVNDGTEISVFEMDATRISTLSTKMPEPLQLDGIFISPELYRMLFCLSTSPSSTEEIVNATTLLLDQLPSCPSSKDLIPIQRFVPNQESMTDDSVSTKVEPFDKTETMKRFIESLGGENPITITYALMEVENFYASECIDDDDIDDGVYKAMDAKFNEYLLSLLESPMFLNPAIPSYGRKGVMILEELLTTAVKGIFSDGSHTPDVLKKIIYSYLSQIEVCGSRPSSLQEDDIASTAADSIIFSLEALPDFASVILEDSEFVDRLSKVFFESDSSAVRKFAYLIFVRLAEIADRRYWKTVLSLLSSLIPRLETSKYPDSLASAFEEFATNTAEGNSGEGKAELSEDDVMSLSTPAVLLAGQLKTAEVKETIDKTVVDEALCAKMKIITELVKAGGKRSADLIAEGDFVEAVMYHLALEVPNLEKHGPLQPPVCKSFMSQRALFAMMKELGKASDDVAKKIADVIGGAMYDVQSKYYDEDCDSELEEMTPDERFNFRRINEWDWEHDPEGSLRCHEGYCGLQNLGCTCYMNSSLQQLFMIPEFRDIVLSQNIITEEDKKDSDDIDIDDDDSDNEDCAIADTKYLLPRLQTLFSRLTLSMEKSPTTKRFTCTLRNDGMPLNTSEQLDSCELLLSVVDGVKDAFSDALKENKSEEISSTMEQLQDIFVGKTRREMRSKGCGHVSRNTENFTNLSVDIKGCETLEEALAATFRPEVFSGANQYRCGSCNELRDAESVTSIERVPGVLFLQLKRFEFDYCVGIRRKIDSELRFPRKLDLSPYYSGENPKEEAVLDLAGVVVHTGTADSGHYYSYIRVRDSPDGPERWLEFNDSRVEYFNIDTLDSACFGGSEPQQRWNYKTKTYETVLEKKPYSAYILVYEKSSFSARRLGSRPSGLSASEAHVPEPLQHSIWLENSRLAEYAAAYNPRSISLLASCLPSASEDCVKKTITCFFERCIRTDSASSVSELADALSGHFVHNPETSLNLLQELLSEFNFPRSMLYCTSEGIRRALSRLTCSILSAIPPAYSIEELNARHEVGKPKKDGRVRTVADSPLSQLADKAIFALNALPERWQALPELLSIITALASHGEHERTYLREKGAMGRLADCYLWQDSPIPAAKERKPLGTNWKPVDYTHLVEALAHLWCDMPLREVGEGMCEPVLSFDEKNVLIDSNFFVKAAKTLRVASAVSEANEKGKGPDVLSKDQQALWFIISLRVSYGKSSSAVLLRKCFQEITCKNDPKNIAGKNDNYYERERKKNAATAEKDKKDGCLEVLKVLLLGMAPGRPPLSDQHIAGLASQFVRLLMVSIRANKTLEDINSTRRVLEIIRFAAERSPIYFSNCVLSALVGNADSSLLASLLGPQNPFDDVRTSFSELLFKWCKRVGQQPVVLLASIVRFMFASVEKVHLDNAVRKSYETKSETESSVVGPLSQYIKAFASSLVNTKLGPEIDFRETLHWLISITPMLEPEDTCFYEMIHLIFAFIMCSGESAFPIENWDKLADNSHLLLEALNNPKRVGPTANVCDFLLNILTMVSPADGLYTFNSALLLCEQSLFLTLTDESDLNWKKAALFVKQFLRDSSKELVQDFIFANIKMFTTPITYRSQCLFIAYVAAHVKEFDLETDSSSVYPVNKIESLFETLRNGLCYEPSVFECLEIISIFGIPVLSPEALKESAELLLVNAITCIRRMAARRFIDPQKLSSASEEAITEQNKFLTKVHSEKVIKGLARLERAIMIGDTTTEKDALASVLVQGIAVVDPSQEPKNSLTLGKMTVFNSLVRDAASCGVVGTKKKIEMLLLYSCIACLNEETEKMMLELFNTVGLCSESPSEEVFAYQPSFFNYICYCSTSPLLPGFVEQTFRKIFANCKALPPEIGNLQVLISMIGRVDMSNIEKLRVAQCMYILCGSAEIQKEAIEKAKDISETLNDLVIWASENITNTNNEQFTMESVMNWLTSFTSSS